MTSLDNRAPSPRFQSSKSLLRSQNADFRHQNTDDNVYEYVDIAKQSKSPEVKKKPIYDQDHIYGKYVIFCKPSPIEVDKKSKSPPNQNRKNNLDKNSFPLKQKFDESNYFVNSQHELARRLSETSAEIISKFKNLIDYEKAYENGYEDLYVQEHSYEYVDTNRPSRFEVQKIDESQLKHDEHVYEALDRAPSRFRVTRVDESTLKSSQNVYEPICVRPRWVDYLFIPPPPKKDCLGRVQWLNKPVRKKTSIGRKISNKTTENLNKNVCGPSTDDTLKPTAFTNIEEDENVSSGMRTYEAVFL